MIRPIDALTVYECDLPLIRVGRPHDGGYVIAMIEGSTKYDMFLSGGINGENSFECGVLDGYPNLVCNAFDPVPNPGAHHSRYHFTAAPVGYYELEYAKNALVKIDIERAEWEWFDHLTERALAGIAQLVVELHSPHVPESGWDWDFLATLAHTHALVHAHGNNWDGIVEAGGGRLPGTLECTYVRRDLAGALRKNTRPIPGPLDMPNDPSKPDHVIDWEPFVHKLSDDRPTERELPRVLA